jgi:hypothetical protein
MFPVIVNSQSLQFTSWAVDLNLTVPFLVGPQNYSFANDTLTASSDSMIAYIPNKILYNDSSNYIEFYTIDSNYQCAEVIGKYSYQISNDSLIFNLIYDSCGHRDFLFTHNWVRTNTDIQNKYEKFIIKTFPNPTTESITILLNNFNGNIQTEVYDLVGNKLQTSNETTISLRDYSKGIYILKVAYGDKVEEVKVIKD